MNIYKTLFLFVLFCNLLPTVVVQAQDSSCNLEVISSEFILESDYKITILVEVQSNNIDAEGIAYLINNIDLQLFDVDIFWAPASFSVHSDDETFQVAISGTSTSVITFPDDLEISGRIAFSFNEQPILSDDNDVKDYDEDSVLVVGTTNSGIDEEDVIVLDSAIISIDTLSIETDTVLMEIDSLAIALDTLTVEANTLSMVDNSGVEFEDSSLLIITPLSSDSILIGYELLLLEDLPNLCEVNYVCELPVVNENDAIVNEVRISNDGNIDKNKNDLTETNFGSIFDSEIFKMEELSINVFPNPAVEYFYIHSNNATESSEVIIYTINGNVVLEKDLNKTNYSKINTIDLPEGLYFVLLKNDTEASQLTKLIIK